MRLYLDIDSRQFLETPAFPRAIASFNLKRRDTDLIELQFLRDRTVQELPSGTTVKIGLKPASNYEADFIAIGSFSKTGTGTSTTYLLDLNLNTVELNAAFAAATPEPSTLAAMAEVEWSNGVTVSSSRTLPVVIENDVIRGDEGEPADLPLFYTSETSDFLATQAEAQAGTSNTKWMSPLRVAESIAALAKFTQQVTSIAGVTNHNLSANRWHIFTGSPSTGNHTFTLPQNATNGDLVYITFLTSGSTNLEVQRSNYGSTGFVAVSSNLETGKTYLFHYNSFYSPGWRKITFA